MSLWKKLRGTAESIFQIGLSGPQIKNSSGVLQARNSDDSAFARVEAAAPASSTATASDDAVLPQAEVQRSFRRSFLLMGG